MVVEMLVMEVINMKNTIIQEIEQSLLNYLDNSQLDVLHTVLCRCLDKVEIKVVEDTDIHISEFTNMELINKFIAAKEIEGCSERTTKYYYATLIKMDSMITKNVTHLTTDDLRMYLTEYQKINNCSKASIDNIRRNLSSFFSWLEEENYILKSPMKRIHKIKTDKVIKETYSDETLELLRDNCNNLRDLAIIDLLSSTGMRVGELVRLNINDIDFENNIAEFGRLLIGNTIFRGKNIAFRATKLLCEYGFSKLNLNKIILEVYKKNINAFNLYKKIGFKVVKEKTINNKQVFLMELNKNKI